MGIVGSCESCPLQKIKCFCQLPPKALAELEGIRQTRVYPKGMVLFSKKQHPVGMYVLRSGRAKLTTASRQGRTVIVRVAEPGEVLGMSAVISNQAYNVSAETLEVTEACFIARSDLLRFLQGWKEPVLQMGHHLSRELHRSYDHLARIALNPTAKGKLASLLLEWADSGTRLAGNGVMVRFQLTHEEVGELIAVRRETVTRLMRDFHRQGLIRLTGTSIILPDLGKLENLLI